MTALFEAEDWLWSFAGEAFDMEARSLTVGCIRIMGKDV